MGVSEWDLELLFQSAAFLNFLMNLERRGHGEEVPEDQYQDVPPLEKLPRLSCFLVWDCQMSHAMVCSMQCFEKQSAQHQAFEQSKKENCLCLVHVEVKNTVFSVDSFYISLVMASLFVGERKLFQSPLFPLFAAVQKLRKLLHVPYRHTKDTFLSAFLSGKLRKIQNVKWHRFSHNILQTVNIIKII